MYLELHFISHAHESICGQKFVSNKVSRYRIAFYKFLYIFSLQEIWYRYLLDKIKNELRNEKTDPVVLARKRKNADGLKNTAKRKAVQRGIVNWAPPAIAGEDDASCRAHVAWMQKEKKKSTIKILCPRKWT